MEEPNNCVEVRRKHNQHPADVSHPFEDGNRCHVSAVAENVRISWSVAHPCNRATQNRMSSFGSSKNARASTLPGYRSHVPAQCSMEDLLSPGESTSLSATQSLGRNSSLPQPGPHSLRGKKAVNSDRAAGLQQTKSSFLCHDCDPKLHKSSSRFSSVRKPANHEAKLLFAKKVSNFPVSDPVFLKNRMLKELTQTRRTSRVNEKTAMKNYETSNIETSAEKLPKQPSNRDNFSYSPKNKSPASAVDANLFTHTEECGTPNHKFQELAHDSPSNLPPSLVENSNRILALQKHDRTNTSNKVTRKEDNGTVSVKSSFPLTDTQTRFRHSSFATTDEVPHLLEEKSISDDISNKIEQQGTCQPLVKSSNTLPYSANNVKDINQMNLQSSVGIFEESNSLPTDASVFHEAQHVEVSTGSKMLSKDSHLCGQDCALSPGPFSLPSSANSSCCGTPSYEAPRILRYQASNTSSKNELCTLLSSPNFPLSEELVVGKGR